MQDAVRITSTNQCIASTEMFNQSILQQVWDHTHQEKPTSEQPDTEFVAFAEHLGQQLSLETPVLDVGCGRGRNAFYLSRAGFAVYACDLSPVAITVATARAQRADATINFQVADLTHLPYPDNSFAALVCVHVLPYNLKADMVRGGRELQRVLRPDGWLYFDLLGCDDAEYGCGPELEAHTFLELDGMPIHFSSRQEVDELMDGFAVERASRFELGSSTRLRTGWVVWAKKCL
ncbi:MAG: class I SAM-dependent methyltransferase [Chloroflexi bacterium]|nr:class I SAM-dependent methyltransferase [Chloroflexota bacterium]